MVFFYIDYEGNRVVNFRQSSNSTSIENKTLDEMFYIITEDFFQYHLLQ